MALADGTSSIARIESMESRRMFAFTTTGVAGTFGGTVNAVESAAAGSDAAQTRYATYIQADGQAFVVPVSGVDSSTPGTPIALPSMGGTISNTDVATGNTTGSFVVTYEVTTSTGGGMNGGPVTTDSDIYAAVFANGVSIGTPVKVNTTTAGNQSDSRVAMDGSGNFIVVWQSDTGNPLVARRFNADGTGRSAEFGISSAGVEPDVAANATGQFVITWATSTQTFAQLYSASGAAADNAVTVAGAGFSEPAVALTNTGRFVVAYAENSGGVRTVEVQRYDTASAADGAAFPASDDTTLNQNVPEIAADTRGGFTVGWAQATTGTAYDTAAFRAFTQAGVPVDTTTVVSGVQFGPDFRFGLAYRVANTVHIAYATNNVGTMQTYTEQNGGGGGGAGELPVPAGALEIDLSADLTGDVVIVDQTSSTISVIKNGVATTQSLSGITSIYVIGSALNDYVRLNASVTLPAIIYGRDGADTLVGGEGADIIEGGDGEVTRNPDGTQTDVGNIIQGRDGNDTIYGGAGDDTVYGGNGDDALGGGPGRNVVNGENGNDTLTGGERGDVLNGGIGDDLLNGMGGGDNLDGGRGNDTLNGGDGDDRLFGDRGQDFLDGGDGNDSLSGGRDDDSLYGDQGNDTLVGGANSDLLVGGGSNLPSRVTGTLIGDIAYYDTTDHVRSTLIRLLVP